MSPPGCSGPSPWEPARPVTLGGDDAAHLWPSDAHQLCQRLAHFLVLPLPPDPCPLPLVATCPLILRAQGTQGDPGKTSSSWFLDCRGHLGSAAGEGLGSADDSCWEDGTATGRGVPQGPRSECADLSPQSGRELGSQQLCTFPSLPRESKSCRHGSRLPPGTPSQPQPSPSTTLGCTEVDTPREPSTAVPGPAKAVSTSASPSSHRGQRDHVTSDGKHTPALSLASAAQPGLWAGPWGHWGLPRWTVWMSRSLHVWLLPPLHHWPHVPSKKAGQGGVREGYAGCPACEAGSRLQPTAAGTKRLRSESNTGSVCSFLRRYEGFAASDTCFKVGTLSPWDTQPLCHDWLCA